MKEADAHISPSHEENDENFKKSVGDAEALVVLDRKVTSSIIQEMQKCEVIMSLSVGYDCIDVEAASRKRIPVCNDECWRSKNQH